MLPHPFPYHSIRACTHTSSHAAPICVQADRRCTVDLGVFCGVDSLPLNVAVATDGSCPFQIRPRIPSTLHFMHAPTTPIHIDTFLDVHHIAVLGLRPLHIIASCLSQLCCSGSSAHMFVIRVECTWPQVGGYVRVRRLLFVQSQWQIGRTGTATPCSCSMWRGFCHPQLYAEGPPFGVLVRCASPGDDRELQCSLGRLGSLLGLSLHYLEHITMAIIAWVKTWAPVGAATY